MKWLFLALLLVATTVGATDLTAEWEVTIANANINTTNDDTVYSNVFNRVLSEYSNIKSYWRKVQLSEIDTAFSGDSVFLVLQDSEDGITWSDIAYTNDTIELNGNADTVIEQSGLANDVRIKPDSVYIGPRLRVLMRHIYDMGETAGDTAIVGNFYNAKLKYWLIPSE